MLDLSSHYTADGTRQTTAAEWLARGLYEISQILITTPAPDSLGRVLETLCSLLELRGALLTFVDSDGLRTTEESSWPLQPTGELRGWAHQVIEQVLNDSMPVVVENAWVELAPQPGSDVEHVESELDVSLVGVPIVSGDKLDGALVILRQHSAGDQAAFSFDSDVRLMSSVARISAVSWQLANVSAAEPVPEVAPHPPGDSAAIGRAMCWRAALHTAQTAAKTNATVLLRGETGVGKSLVARLVHEASPRHERPFVAINCAALPENLLESELFGHERGAFTGAMNRRLGRFELAHTGTLFLDEIGEISTAFQAKLLRVLQQGEFERVGGTETISVDVRVVAATHRDLEAAVRAGTFRADLYYRLCVVPVRVPALRERPQDIALLARTFLDRFNAENGTDRSLDDTALAALGAHPF
ncbi:MAG TPA: sigma 54-interacting transcriptional regulator, partial [Polyangiaceae bacterium]|nr:sigma 54-interacting transcriptional regulator [Polyangiaceae bacterium]